MAAPSPTFLDVNSQPSGTRPSRPVSGDTMTTGELAGGLDDFVSAKEQQSEASEVSSATGPVGDVGLPPSRPVTAKRSSMQPPMAGEGWLRPGSAVSTTHTTHVPSLPYQGVFRPMSPQKLQAQRNMRPASAAGAHPLSIGDGDGDGGDRKASADERRGRPRRTSNASVNTLREAPRPPAAEDAPPLPISRGSQFTHDGDGAPHTTASVTTHASSSPLRVRQQPAVTRLDAGGPRTSNTPSSEKAPRSPRSFRASLGLGSRRQSRQEQERRPTGQHEKLRSLPSSPREKHMAEKPLSARTSSTPNTAGKNYEYYAGNMIFFLSGRCMNTKAWPLNVVSFILVTLPALLFFIFSAPYLWHHVSPALPIIFAYVFYLTLSSFLHAAFSDPGILPRNLHPQEPNPEAERDPLALGPPTTDWVMVRTFTSSGGRSAPRRRRADGDGDAEDGRGSDDAAAAMEVPTKFCKSCDIWRPARAHHCRVCDACIETQDHHCVWLNNCVGRRNYRLFFSFVAGASVLGLLLLSFSAAHVAHYAHTHHISFGASLSGRPPQRVAFALLVYSLVGLPYPASLLGYHLFLTSRGETTREYLNTRKFPPRDRHRPFSQSSALRNLHAVLARPHSPSYLQFKRAYVPGDVRLGHVVPERQRAREQLLRERDLKTRFSVPGARKKTVAPVEMKPLPPVPAGVSRVAGGGGATAVDRTPR